MQVPFATARRVRELLLACRYPCQIQMDPEYRISDWRGDPEHYGLPRLTPGSDCRALLPALYGLMPDADASLEFVEAPNGRSMDLNLLSSGGGTLLLLTDSTEERNRRRELQQRANDNRLLSRRQGKLLEALQQARGELEQRHREVEQANRFKGRFIAAMSHEFRTPLVAIQGQVELLRDRPGADPAGLDAIDANAAHLLSLIDNILDQARIDSGELLLTPVPTALTALADDIRTMFTATARRRGLGLQVQVSQGCPAMVELDAPRLRQVLVNLLGNALKFTRQGWVALQLDWREGRLRTQVRDTGPGIPRSAQKRVFQAFHQEPSDAGGRREGAGLGLAISAQLVRLMGGRIELESEPGTGALFQFEIPAPISSIKEETDPEQPRVLVVDDSEELRRLLLRQLGKVGIQALEAADAEQALAVTAAERPDVIVLDLYLGDEDGSSVARRLRANGYAGGILILSAASAAEERRRALLAGGDAFMVKPVKADLLRHRVMELARAHARS